METNFNFDVKAKVTSSGKVMLYTRLYVVKCTCDGVEKVIHYYLNRDDAEVCVSVYSELEGYDNFCISENLLFL